VFSNIVSSCIILIISLCFGIVPADAGIIFVSVSANGANNGSNWKNAFTELVSAIKSAHSGDEIWMAAGVYKPHLCVIQSDLRHSSFELKNGVSIYGGFSGIEDNLSKRNFDKNKTVLSGDLNNDGKFSLNDSFHVLHNSQGINRTAILDGFIVTGGNANSLTHDDDSYGGGMFNYKSCPTVRNCIFVKNFARCGGAINNFTSSPLISNCKFFVNESDEHGGAVNNAFNSNPEIIRCGFFGNIAGGNGGAILNRSQSNPLITNSVFSLNAAEYDGGAILSLRDSNVKIINCTLVGNWAQYDGGALSFAIKSNALIQNSIIRDNFASHIAQIAISDSNISILYSNIEGGWQGSGNFDRDSLFIRAIKPRHYKEERRVDDDFGDLRLKPGSPCIDSGITEVNSFLSTDFSGNNRIVDGDKDGRRGIDIGAYEYICENKLPFKIIQLAPDGAWTWFNDERIIVDYNNLDIGGFDSKGIPKVYIYDLENHIQRKYRLDSWKNKDDHDNPTLLKLNNGQFLACYSKHHLENKWYWRVADKTGESLRWRPEKIFFTPTLTTYCNLVQLSAEKKRIYNFSRNIGFNPNIQYSDDNAQSWQGPFVLIMSGGNETRPYVKYADNGIDRIDFLYTDGHPNREPSNNVYHLYYQNGNFYTTDGNVIKSFEQVKQKPLIPSDGTLIYKGKTEGRGWVWDLEYDRREKPVAAFINCLDNEIGNDLRYRYGRWNNLKEQWEQRQIAFVGTYLCDGENQYADGITIDAEDINCVYISSNVDPSTGKNIGTGRYQIYQGKTENHGKTWAWIQLTFDKDADNLRPFVPRSHKRKICVIWLHGHYHS